MNRCFPYYLKFSEPPRNITAWFNLSLVEGLGGVRGASVLSTGQAHGRLLDCRSFMLVVNTLTDQNGEFPTSIV